MNTDFENNINKIYELLKNNNQGNVASYIPQLAEVDPKKFAISICFIDGKTINLGDYNDMFCMQSCSKPLSYCISRELNDLKDIHKHVGYEPSGQAFNAFTLNRQKIPHNPLINAGAIMIASLIEPKKEPSKRFETVKNFYQKMTGNNGNIGFDNSVFLSEKHHADRNISLAYYMRENKAFPENTGPSEISSHLDLYFQCCSININAKMGACIAATLANGGVCPQTGAKVFNEESTRDCLSLMYMCGMYDYSGQFAFEIGLPAKSGVSGCLLLVIPNKMGICIWSPRLDDLGNTVRGVEFCKMFTKKTNKKYHIFRTITKKNIENQSILENNLITACSNNDLEKVKELSKKININISDYDKRTPLHLSCSEGNLDIVKFLLENNCNKDVKDRWENTPLSDAMKGLEQNKDNPEKNNNYNEIIKLLQLI
jgi:glutaminase